MGAPLPFSFRDISYGGFCNPFAALNYLGPVTNNDLYVYPAPTQSSLWCRRVRPRSSARRGMALVTAILFGVLCLSLSVGFLLQVPVDLAATTVVVRDAKASFVADAGVQDTMAWISHQLAGGLEPCSLSAPTPIRSGTLGAWTWACTIEPDAGTPPNSLTPFRIYKLTSTASLDGRAVRQIVTQVQAGQSFARFSMFTDQNDPSIWDFGVHRSSRIRGPVHKNRPIRFLVDGANYAGSTPPPTTPFDGIVSTTAGSHTWSAGSDPADNAGKYGHLFKRGLSDLKFGTPPRPLPGSALPLAQAAWGGTIPPAPPFGVSVNPTGGVYIEGDVDVMRLEVNGSGNFVLRIEQSGQTTTVEENRSTGQRIVTSSPGGVVTIPGLGNGVVFATGSIFDLKGVNQGARTIAVDFDSGKDIEVSGTLSRRDTVLGSEPTGIDDRLGIVAEHIYIADETVLPRSVGTPLHIYATLLATQRLEVKNRSTGSPGALAIHGGLASGWPSLRGTVNASFTVVSGYGGLSGYGSPDIVYDPLLANAPPPEYPTTAGTELTVRSWFERPL